MGPAISLQDVRKVYDRVPVVEGLSFAIQPGEMFGLLGPNGAGKSTTIRMLIALTRPSQGLVEVAGFDVTRHPARVKANIGVVLQQTSVDTELTVWENMEFHGRMHHIPNPRRRKAISQWLEYVQLEDRRDSLVKTLSGGMKRRLQIARALLHDPSILFMDEPTVGLDPQTRLRLWEIVRDLNGNGKTILLTTHYMEEAAFLCDRIGIMDAGKFIESGTLAELRQKYGEGLIVKQTADRLTSELFPTLEAASQHLDSLPDRTGVMCRPSNLEDIFVELTGRRLD
ncbi:ABC-type multidrug transport system, ATPase component [Rubidibacter lacunae KORDI 51-2]|uniref:ABC-type multidrug transport system, ATPase component n=1 Tax=Rubidibacter lacunae KORDI 51-2 TaxID=582515 RepID=U5DQK9_9CHRO|nr:ABC transporter ATP-binding protein [Rubidibacter lacunae]ERN41975.1 ABC-type multidrug transport system, ATPase component [Rubidibacter lacunae KORDI 51-2]